MMNSIEYANKKNKVIGEYVGITLIPDSQIVDLPITAEMITNMEEFVEAWGSGVSDHSILPISSLNCLYCTEYEEFCTKCPMAKEGNKCVSPKDDSTFYTCVEALNKLPSDRIVDLSNDLVILAKEFINSNTNI